MFVKLRRKIILSIVLALLIFLATTICVIYLSSYWEVSKDNVEMLERFSDQYSPNKIVSDSDVPFLSKGNDIPLGKPDNQTDNHVSFPPDRSETMYELSTFYAVAFEESGNVMAVENGPSNSIDESLLVSLAKKVLNRSGDKGHIQNMTYLRQRKDGYWLITFMDNTVLYNQMMMLIRNTLIIGIAAIFIMAILSLPISNIMLAPLRESYEKQRQFISDVGHELKTPIAVMQTNLELMERENGGGRWLENIRYENERISTLVSQMLTLSRMENTQANEKNESINFSNLVLGEALPFESVAFEQGMTLRCDVEPNICIEGNSTRLRQLTGILLDNAICHSEGEEIILSLTSERRQAIFTVANGGKEMSSEQLERLFDRFYRIDTARTGEKGHYGLGLSIAKAIVTGHNGKITLHCKDGKVIAEVILPLHTKNDFIS